MPTEIAKLKKAVERFGTGPALYVHILFWIAAAIFAIAGAGSECATVIGWSLLLIFLSAMWDYRPRKSG